MCNFFKRQYDLPYNLSQVSLLESIHHILVWLRAKFVVIALSAIEILHSASLVRNYHISYSVWVDYFVTECLIGLSSRSTSVCCTTSSSSSPTARWRSTNPEMQSSHPCSAIAFITRFLSTTSNKNIIGPCNVLIMSNNTLKK